MSRTSAPIVPCSCADGWKPEGWAYCAECYEGKIERLHTALEDVIRDINEYERANNLAPNPDRTECWDSVARAKAALSLQEGGKP
jgi:hypothetical protein